MAFIPLQRERKPDEDLRDKAESPEAEDVIVEDVRLHPADEVGGQDLRERRDDEEAEGTREEDLDEHRLPGKSS